MNYYKKYKKYQYKFNKLNEGKNITCKIKKYNKVKKNSLITKKLIEKHVELTYKVYKYDLIIHPLLELKRIELLNQLSVDYNKDIKIIMLMCYSINLNSLDPVFCTNIPKFINGWLKNYEFTDSEIKKLNDKLLNCVNIVKKLNDKINKTCIKIVKHVNNDFCKLTYKNHSVTLPVKSYNRIKSLVTKQPKVHIDVLIWCLMYRYTNLDLLTGLQGAMTPEHYKYLSKKHKLNVECFGSFINHINKYYFGLFYDLEQYVGCLGNFYNSELHKGFFAMNPPYITHLMNKAINHMLTMLDNNKITVIVTIPVWDIDDRKLMNEQLGCKKKLATNYKTDLIQHKLKNSKFLQHYLLYCKEDFLYYDYINEQYVHFSLTNIAILSSSNVTVSTKFLPNRNVHIKPQ